MNMDSTQRLVLLGFGALVGSYTLYKLALEAWCIIYGLIY
jgi:hypothetical protein